MFVRVPGKEDIRTPNPLELKDRRDLTNEERGEPINRIYVILLVMIFGVITIVNLSQAVFESFRFYLLDPLDEFNRDSAGGKLSLSIVALPMWVIYLVGTIRAVRRESRQNTILVRHVRNYKTSQGGV